MGQHIVQAPDGSQHIIEAPDNATPQQITQFLDYAAPGHQEAPQIDPTLPAATAREKIRELPTDQQDAARNAWAKGVVEHSQVPMLGGPRGPQDVETATPEQRGIPFIGPWMNKLGAGIGQGIYSLTGGARGRPYEEGLALRRAEAEDYDARHPLFSAGRQIVTNAAMTPVLPAETILGNSARFGTLAGAEGFNAGVANNDGTLSDKIDAGMQQGETAGIIGAAFPPAAALATRPLVAVGSAISPQIARLSARLSGGNGADAAADQIIANRIRNAGQTPAQLQADLDAGQEAARLGPNSRAQNPEMLADQSDGLRRLTGSAYRAGGEGAEDISAALQGRQRGPANPYEPRPRNSPPQGQLERIKDAYNRAMGLVTSDSARATEADLIAEQKARADQNYDMARQNSDDFDLQPVIDAMAQRKMQYPAPFASKLQEASDLFAPQQSGQHLTGNALAIKAQHSVEDVPAVQEMWKFVKANNRRAPETLTSWLQRMGGIKDQGGEVSRILGNTRARPGLISSNGLNLDDAALRAHEQGFFHGGERPTIRDFLDYLDEDSRHGSIVRQEDQPALDNFHAAREMENDLADLGVLSARTPEEVERRLTMPGQRPKAKPLNPLPQRYNVDNIERFDNAKQALDDMIEREMRAGNNRLAARLVGFKEDLLEKVHEGGKNPFYAKAREDFATAAEQQHALQLGRNALKEDSEVSTDQFNDLTTAQQKLFRIGLRESINRTFGPKTPGDDVTRVFQQRRVRELLNAALPRGQGALRDTPQRFGEYMSRAERQVQTRNAVLGNSATAGRQADDAELNGEVLSNAFNRLRHSATPTGLIIESVAALGRRFFSLRRDTAAALAQRLMETDPVARRAYLQHLSQNFGPGAVREFLSGLDEIAGRSGTAISQQAQPSETLH